MTAVGAILMMRLCAATLSSGFMSAVVITTTAARFSFFLMIQGLATLAGLLQPQQSSRRRIDQLIRCFSTAMSLINTKLPGEQLAQHLLTYIAYYDAFHLFFGQQINHLLFA